MVLKFRDKIVWIRGRVRIEAYKATRLLYTITGGMVKSGSTLIRL